MPARPMRKCSCGDEHPCSTLAKERAEAKTPKEPTTKKPDGDEGKTKTPTSTKVGGGDLEKRAKSFLRDLIG